LYSSDPLHENCMSRIIHYIGVINTLYGIMAFKMMYNILFKSLLKKLLLVSDYSHYGKQLCCFIFLWKLEKIISGFFDEYEEEHLLFNLKVFNVTLISVILKICVIFTFFIITW